METTADGWGCFRWPDYHPREVMEGLVTGRLSDTHAWPGEVRLAGLDPELQGDFQALDLFCRLGVRD